MLPKDVRARLRWDAGQTLEVVEHLDGVILRRTPRAEPDAPTPDEIFARISARNSYRGPRISDEDIDRALLETAALNDAASRLK